MSANEVAQTLRCGYPDTPIFFVATDKKSFEKKNLIKNGFNQAYLMPWEKADLIKEMNLEVFYSAVPELRNYKPIKAVDIVPGTVLDFSLNIFLPMNNKFLPFSQEGSPVSDEKIKKLVESNLNTLFVKNDDLEKFYKYTASIFDKLLKPGAISETERRDKLEKCVRDLVSDMFVESNKENTFAKSHALLGDVKAIIGLMIKNKNQDLLKQVNALVNQEKNFYLHFSNTATYAGLFAIALGFENADSIALAGLLHDVGKINLPQEYADIDEEDLDKLGPHIIEAYKKHPMYSLDVIKMKRMVISPETSKAIVQHHEAINGCGYPNKMEGHKITKEARILAIADQFDSLTNRKPGKKDYTPFEALNLLYEDNSKDPSRVILDIDMIKKLKDIFIGKEL